MVRSERPAEGAWNTNGLHLTMSMKQDVVMDSSTVSMPEGAARSPIGEPDATDDDTAPGSAHSKS